MVLVEHGLTNKLVMFHVHQNRLVLVLVVIYNIIYNNIINNPLNVKRLYILINYYIININIKRYSYTCMIYIILYNLTIVVSAQNCSLIPSYAATYQCCGSSGQYWVWCQTGTCVPSYEIGTYSYTPALSQCILNLCCACATTPCIGYGAVT